MVIRQLSRAINQFTKPMFVLFINVIKVYVITVMDGDNESVPVDKARENALIAAVWITTVRLPGTKRTNADNGFGHARRTHNHRRRKQGNNTKAS